MLASIFANQALWNVHLWPQTRFLRFHNGTKLPLDYIGRVEAFETSVHRIFHDDDLHMVFKDGPGQNHHPLHIPPLNVTVAEARVLCQLYYEDYVALDLMLPVECRSWRRGRSG